MAYDTIMVFQDHFRNHILPDKLHMLNVSFLALEMRREFGGCAGNIAYNLKLMGDDPRVMATVGHDFGPYAAWMDKHHVSREYLRGVTSEHTGQAFITTDLDNNQITAFHPGAMGHSHLNSVADAQDIAVGIVAPDGRDGMIQHAVQFAAAGVPFIFDPGQGLPMFGGEDLKTFIEQASWVTVNDYEWSLMAERTGWKEADVCKRVAALGRDARRLRFHGVYRRRRAADSTGAGARRGGPHRLRRRLPGGHPARPDARPAVGEDWSHCLAARVAEDRVARHAESHVYTGAVPAAIRKPVWRLLTNYWGRSEITMSHSYLFTSESVSEGHPDKVADQISDAILDAILAEDKYSRVAAETLCNTGLVVLAGEITTKAKIDYHSVARGVIKDIGYDNTDYGIDYKGCAVLVAYDTQSPDIAQGVDEGKGLNLDQGAGDQGLMFGYACQRDCRTDAAAAAPFASAGRASGAAAQEPASCNWLRPDAKSQVTIKYVDGKPDSEIDTVVLSTQHHPEIEPQGSLTEAVIEEIIKPVLPPALVGKGKINYLINPTGRFRSGWTAGRLRPHRPQDHRRHLRRRCAARRWRILGQGSHQGGSLCGLCRALCGEECGRRGSRRSLPGAGVLRHRRGQAHQHHGHHLRHRQDQRMRRSRQLIAKHFDLRPKGIVQMLDLLRPDLPQDGSLRPLRSQRANLQLGEDRQGCGAEAADAGIK